MVLELLHTGALTLTGLGACCVAADRPRARVRELALGVLALLAMGDIVLWHVVAPVWWCAALVAASVLSVLAAPGRRFLAGDERAARAMDAIGGVVMGALMLLMTDPKGAVEGVHAGHGASLGLVTALVCIAALAYAVGALRMAVRMPRRQHSTVSIALRRLAPVAMSGSMLLMTAAVVL